MAVYLKIPGGFSGTTATKQSGLTSAPFKIPTARHTTENNVAKRNIFVEFSPKYHGTQRDLAPLGCIGNWCQLHLLHAQRATAELVIAPGPPFLAFHGIAKNGRIVRKKVWGAFGDLRLRASIQITYFFVVLRGGITRFVLLFEPSGEEE